MNHNSMTSQRLFIGFLMFLGGLGGLLYGYDIGVISGALLFMNSEIPMTTAQNSLLVGAMLGGGAIATLVAGPVADWIGRRKTILISGLIFLVGMLILVTASGFVSALLGRLIQGAGIGIEMIILPLYLAETTPPEVRGRSITLFQLFLTFGIVSAYAINLLFEQNHSWRGMFMVVMVPGLILSVITFFIPESPRWLCWKGRFDAALDCLSKTRARKTAEHDLAEIKSTLTSSDTASLPKSSLWQRRYVLPFLIALSIACLNQLTGINVFLQYATLIFKHAGISSNVGAMVSTVGVGVVNAVVTLIAVFLIDKVGRKPLLTIGTAGTVCSLIFLGFITHGNMSNPTVGHLVLIGLLVYIAFYAIGPGVVVWLALSELMPLRIRSKGMSVALFANSAVSAGLTSFFLPILAHINLSGAFFIFASCTILYFVIAAFVLPETKQRTLEDIEHYFQRKK